jgi:uncharacterized protein (DUF302 family)
MVASLGIAQADSPLVYQNQVKGELEAVYKRLFTALENNGYYVVFEPNIGKNLAYFAKRWGDDYNKNNLDAIRSMVFYNNWYANKVSNEDPSMLAIYPLHITVIHKADITQVLFVRPSKIAAGSPAEKTAKEMEQDVIRTIERSLHP